MTIIKNRILHKTLNMGKIVNSKLVVTIIVLLVAFFLIKWVINEYSDIKKEINIRKQNELALQDSLRVSKNKVGDLEYSKAVLIAKNQKELKQLNSELADLAKTFTGKISELTKVVANIKGDTIIIDNTKLITLPDNTNAFKWAYNKSYDKDNYRNLEGLTKFKFDSITNLIEPLETIITRDDIGLGLVLGLRTVKDNKVEMFASSKYPNLMVSEFSSVIIDPDTHPALKLFSKKKRFGLSIYGGVGGTFDLSESKLVFGPQIGAGASYILW